MTRSRRKTPIVSPMVGQQELNDILEAQARQTAVAEDLRDRRDALRTSILRGKTTTGDPATDFCALHDRFDENEIKRIADMRERIDAAIGRYLAVETLFYYCVSMNSNRSEYEPSGLQILRLTTIRQPAWTRDGLEIPGPYAYHASSEPAHGGSLELFREENARRLPVEWSVAPEPLALGAGELFDDIDGWPSPYTRAQRPDLAQAIRERIASGPLHLDSNQIACRTKVYTGSSARKLFGDRYGRKRREDCLNDALATITHGKSRRER